MKGIDTILGRYPQANHLGCSSLHQKYDGGLVCLPPRGARPNEFAASGTINSSRASHVGIRQVFFQALK